MSEPLISKCINIMFAELPHHLKMKKFGECWTPSNHILVTISNCQSLLIELVRAQWLLKSKGKKEGKYFLEGNVSSFHLTTNWQMWHTWKCMNTTRFQTLLTADKSRVLAPTRKFWLRQTISKLTSHFEKNPVPIQA